MKNNIRYIKLAMVALTLLFIWGNSMLPAALSSLESGYAEQLLRPLLLPLQAALAHVDVVLPLEQLVRKLAHFTEYFVLGVLMFILFIRPNGHSRFWLAELLCLLTALIDEGIQMFSTGRGPSLWDSGLDFSGSTLGIVLCAVVLALFRQLLRRRTPPSTQP